MRILVTGGAGFIGSHVVDGLLAEGHDVVIVDNLSPSAHDGPPSYLDDRAELHYCDLTDLEAMTRAVDQVDAVAHLAARVGLGVNGDDVDGYAHDNDLGTAVLLKALWRRRFTGRLMVASSMVVYGAGLARCPTHGCLAPPDRTPEDLAAGCFEPRCPECSRPLEPELLSEDAPLRPCNTYAATKLHTEQLAFVYGRETGAPVLALRYHNVYGDRMPSDTPYAGVASLLRSAFETGVAPRIFEDGNQRRDFIHVDDVAHATVLALGAPPEVVGPCNVGSGEVHTIGELAVALADAYGASAPAPRITGEWRAGDVRHLTASSARAERMLGFRARVPFGDGVVNFAKAERRRPPAWAGYDG